ncbi:unnamed protein product [Mycena citricolor]|uniref:beta-galactosidase n=1 Tax=Mycena citricolor TaxID=2018698 RepID=A0AAD2H955_9AGAR|nr:unnamed protein product [Mycena citricolor]
MGLTDPPTTMWTTTIVLALLVFATNAFGVRHPTALQGRNSTGLTDVITWDGSSLSIMGQRVFILSAEFHPWRLPGNPELWADVFDKIKSNGFNTVSFCVHWGQHYPAPDTNNGQGDFQQNTYRDMELFIQEAQKAGLWLIARPGPYTNAEATGGGLPGWVGNIAGSLRTNNPNYTQTWVPYMNSISQVIARNQVTEGGPIILVQAEVDLHHASNMSDILSTFQNEYSAGATHAPYMQAIIDLYRANGIVIPITFNDQHSGANGSTRFISKLMQISLNIVCRYFSPDAGGEGAVNIFCGDTYPQGTNSWSQVQSVYYSLHKAIAPSNPLCLAEFGGGYLLNWGASAFGGTGYEKFSISPGLTNADYENVFYKDAIAQTTTILNIYMVYGGTNWGQTAAPVSYTSYDYGGGINENRIALVKMNEMRLQGAFLRVSRDLLAATLLGNGTNYTTSSLIYTAELRNLDTGAGFYITRQNNTPSTDLVTTRIQVQTSIGALLVPQAGSITFNGRDSKIIVTDYVFGASQTTILYSTTEYVYSRLWIDNKDYVILYAEAGQTGETAFMFGSHATQIIQPNHSVNSRILNGSLILDYTLNGTAFIPISIGTSQIIVILVQKDLAYQWHAPLIAGNGKFGNYFSIGTNSTLLVSGPYVLRTANINGRTLSLTGDLNGTTAIEIVAPQSVSQFKWNNAVISTIKTPHGSHVGTIGKSVTLSLPELGNWKVSGGLPEIDLNFDDSSFTVANLTTTNYTNLPPLSGSQVLYSQQYGFYGGNLIFRGRFQATGQETAVNLTVMYGFAGGYSAWLNGIFLGSSQGNATVSSSSDVWVFPSGAVKTGKTNVLVVLQDHMGLSEANTNGAKEPRGIRGYVLIGGETKFSNWTLQGNLGGAAGTPDTFRGYLNEGGLYPERIGAHLPDFPDKLWPSGSPLTGLLKAGVNFYRTTFDFPVPDGVDAPIRLSILQSSAATPTNFRLQIYLNGWQVGKYINSIGPQTIFVLPASILKRHGSNTLALSLWAMDQSGAAVEGLEIISDGYFSTSLPLQDYPAPDFSPIEKALRPADLHISPM